MMENANNKNLTVSDLINILDKEYNRRTANGTDRLIMIQVNGECFGYLKSVKLDGYGSGLIADVCMELETEENDGWIPVEKGLPEKEGVYDVTVIDGLGEKCLVTWQFLSGIYLNNSQTYVDGIHYWASNYNGDPINKFLSGRVTAWRHRPEPYRKDGD